MPLNEPMAATDGLLLLHAPPADDELNGVVAPAHTAPAPVMMPGSGLMVITALPLMTALQPVVASVAVIV